MKKAMSHAALDKLVKSGQVRVVEKKPVADPALKIERKLDQVAAAIGGVTAALQTMAATKAREKPAPPMPVPASLPAPSRPSGWRFEVERHGQTGMITTITAREIK